MAAPAYYQGGPPPVPYGAPQQQEPLFIFGYAPQAGGYLPCFKHTDRLHSQSVEGPTTLREGQMLYSKNRMWYLTVRSTGELAICLSDHSQAWTNAKSGYSRRGDPPYRLVMQQDANLVVYDGGNKAVWSSKTGDTRRGQTSFVAVMQDDRNFVIYDDNMGVVWASHSHY